MTLHSTCSPKWRVQCQAVTGGGRGGDGGDVGAAAELQTTPASQAKLLSIVNHTIFAIIIQTEDIFEKNHSLSKY